MPRLVFAILLLLFSPALSLAAIGRPFDSGETARLGYTSLTTTPMAGGLTSYTMTRTVKNPVTGFDVTETLRQIAGPGGVIFGLSWSGIHHPDLSKVLGGRLPSLLPYQRGVRTFSTSRLVLHMAGTVIHSEGEAWDPALVPPGVSPLTLLALP